MMMSALWGEVATVHRNINVSPYLPFLSLSRVSVMWHKPVRGKRPVRRQNFGYLPSFGALPLFRQYQSALLVDTGTCALGVLQDRTRQCSRWDLKPLPVDRESSAQPLC